MKEKRIKFSTIVENQLPAYVKEEFPLISEFLKQYYISQEFQGAPADLVQNVDQYIKLESIKGQVDFVILDSDISFFDETITIDINKSITGTKNFPTSYGLLQIDDEIITYTGITTNSFTGCVRGFSGITTYTNDQDQLIFKSSLSSNHSKGSKIVNLSSLFLNNFFKKIKYQFTPGFEDREFYQGFDEELFVKQSKDFYSTRGTDLSFKILFKALYGEEVTVIKPQSYLFKPSDAQYQLVNNLVAESVSGDPLELINSTIYQDEYENIPKGYASISKVESIYSSTGKLFYKLSFDGGYNRDITYDGSLYGQFTIHPKTKLIGEIVSGDTILTVDSTVGFPSKGTLYITYNDGTIGLVNYGSKNLNQFLECTGITKIIPDGSDIFLNVFVKGRSNKNNEEILLRVTSVLSDVEVPVDSYYYGNGNSSIIKTLGVTSDDVVSNSFIYNIANTVNIESISLKATNVYNFISKEKHFLRKGDSLKIISNDEIENNLIVTNIVSENEVDIEGVISDFNSNKKYKFKRNILKVSSESHSQLLNQIANVQNVYKDDEKTLVASLSLPYYRNYPLNPSNKSFTFSISVEEGVTLQSFTINNHNFYTGDAVYFTPGSGSGFDNLFAEGLYFVKKINENVIQLTRSKFDLYNNINLVSVAGPVNISSNKLEYYDFRKKSLKPQNILREISQPINDENEYLTGSNTTGILVNGVEILSYKSKDKIYYGPLEEIEVLSNGYDYDVINPPALVISDSTGIGATGYCSVSGSLREIRIIDSGFDYLEPPRIVISGGNGSGAKANALMKEVDHEVSFNSASKVNLSTNTIGFSTYHKFRNFERIIYKTNGNNGIGGITTNSSYYISAIDELNIKLHKTFDDALAGINTISLTSYGEGDHFFKSFNKKSVIWSINVEDSGSNYENKKRTTKSSGISTFSDQIYIKNHDFSSGEIVNYSTSGTSIGGLTNNSDYYVTKIDDDNFKLSLVGIGSTNKDFYYSRNEFINLTSGGSGTHVFNYPQISVSVIGKTGVFLPNETKFEAVIQPIFRGEITSVHLEENGVGYGSSDILNYYKEPLITLNSGSNSDLTPIISNGKIVDVSIKNPGKDYYSIPDIEVETNGSGIGAVLTPIIENNKIVSVKVIEGGSGYIENNTIISAISPGLNAKFRSKIKSWTVSRFAKNFNDIELDDGIVQYTSNSKYGLQYCHLYAPRRLREMIGDLQISGGAEIQSSNHSPIIGWAYDGNPIYGPYGYQNKDGGSIVRMKSGYVLNILNDRPPFPEGFFVEDYTHYYQDDDDILDEFNGRFCATPEFPNGTYAYFATIEGSTSSDFSNYRLPSFPYFIGNKFKSKPNEFNFKRSSNQDQIDLNSTNWIRNTSHYQLLRNNTSYDYLFLPNNLNQTFNIKNTLPGSIEKISILSGGTNYKVNDRIIVNETGTLGYGFLSKVSKISGKSVNSITGITSEISNVKIYPGNSISSYILESDNPHQFSNKDFIRLSGLNTTSTLLDGNYQIEVNASRFTVSSVSGIQSSASTGIVTYFSVNGIFNSNIKENDIFLINDEKIKVLNIDKKSSRMRVLREIEGTVGTAHSYNDILYEIPRRFSIVKDKFDFPSYKKNREIYFDPKDSLGIGNSFGVGIGKTIVFSNPGVGLTQIFIPTKTIYLPNHNLETGDSLTYSTNYENGLGGISVSDNGLSSRTLSDQSLLYVAKISNDLIGISTVRVGLSSNGTFSGITTSTKNISTLYFTGIGSGFYHSFKTNYYELKGEVSQNVAIVSLAETHGLTNNDTVFVDVNPGVSKTFVIKYDDYNRKILLDPRPFDASDVNVSENSIKIENHGFKNGQKVLYTSNSPIGGLINKNLYYIFVSDKDTVKLTNSYYDAINQIPNIINLTSSSSGVLSPVNPPIKTYRGFTLNFDLSDSSLSYVKDSIQYPAFEFNFYLDSNFTQKFYKSELGELFEVQQTGIIGIDANAKVSLTINSKIPKTLFYSLDPVYNNNYLPDEKKEIQIDESVHLFNEIKIVESEYSGEHKIVSLSSTSFSYNIKEKPENSYYVSTTSSLSYNTNSLSGFGSITEVDIINGGKNYYSIPVFGGVETKLGTGALLEFFGESIGKIQKNTLRDIGFDFPSDFSLRPYVSYPQILKVQPLNSFDYIKITSKGVGYISPPKLVVLDGSTKDIISELEFDYSLDDNFVTILNNTYRLYNTTPTIIPTQNTNGVGISSISYDFLTKDVTVTLSQGFDLGEFPFEVNDMVLIENGVTVETDGVRGFNSSDYGYELFSITAIDDNPGGYGSITYNISKLLNSGETPGTYDFVNSLGTVIPKKYFPTFTSKLKPNDFYLKEKIKYPNQSNIIGFVENWDRRIKFLSVISREILKVGTTVEGNSSKSQGIISEVFSANVKANYSAYSKIDEGWITETGFLNSNTQRIQDSLYYQNFSYSLKSRIPYDTWENAVSTLNHTAGFIKFADYQCESVGIGSTIIYTPFNGSDYAIVNLSDNTISVPGHPFVTGEEINYTPNHAIGIATVDFGTGVGITDMLPRTVYAIRVDENKIKLAKNSGNALKNPPEELIFTSVGIGTRHRFTSTFQNSRIVISEVDTITDIADVVDFNTTSNFDLASENNFVIDSDIISNRIILANRDLVDYFESSGNRVLTIDNFSDKFDGDRRNFTLTSNNNPIFERVINGSNSSIVNVSSSIITIPNHYFVTGEKINYNPHAGLTTNSIGISTTDFGVGIGTTDKLPSTIYIIKISEDQIKLAKSAEDALKGSPVALTFTSVGIGTSHSFTSTNQNTRVVVTIDNIIQSPVVSTSITTGLSTNITSGSDVLTFNSTKNFFNEDLIKIGDEIMKISSVGIGSTVKVYRSWMGTQSVGYSTGQKVTKIDGSYNIVGNQIHFVEAPYSKVPISTTSNPPEEQDWSIVSKSSSFHGRVFIRSGITNSLNDSYSKNVVLDDISNNFDGKSTKFSIKKDNSNISGVSSESFILINNIFQTPGFNNSYTLSESLGITTITFVGSGTSLPSDVNTSNLPIGKVILSVGSTEGFGYQPLVSAGATAVVSASGTISSVSIGSSGSGYRNFVETFSGISPVTVRVGVSTGSLSTPRIEFIGTAVVSNGRVVSVAITNPGVGYTRTNPPKVFIDDPIPYSDIPLIYSSTSSGIGSQATVDVIVGQGSSIIDFEIKNNGYGYQVGDILTLPTGGLAGIPTVIGASFKEFRLTVDKTFTDKFNGWILGEFKVFDNIESLFNGKRKIFPIIDSGQLVSVNSKKGSNIDNKNTLLILLNDVLQIPGEGYIFNGGSRIEFAEAPSFGDKCSILFYKGTGSVDVTFTSIFKTIKSGDELILGQSPYDSSVFSENSRVVTEIETLDTVKTNKYFGPENRTDELLLRSLSWKKQTEDKIVNNEIVTKDRILYEPLINPTTYLIENVGISTSIIFVESIRPFFNPLNEINVSLDFQKKVTILSQDSKVSASATAIVSAAGTISSIIINNGGVGYTTAPRVSISNPVGIGTTRSTASATINSGVGSVTSITLVGIVSNYSQLNPPLVLIEPPAVKFETDDVQTYSGDFGVITGIAKTSIVGVALTGLILDFAIPIDSYLRNSSLTEATVVSGIKTGYYFTVSGSNVGNGLTALNSSGNIIGVTTNYIDGVYQAASVSIAQTSTPGIGITFVARVTVSVSSYNGLSGIGFSNYYGNYSWGRIVLSGRNSSNSYNAYTNNGYTGITTGTVIVRTNSLKYKNL